MTNNKTNKNSLQRNLSFKEFFDIKAHLGHPVSKTHPNIHNYLLGKRNGISIFNLQTTLLSIKKAVKFIYFIGTIKANILFVFSKTQKEYQPLFQSITKQWPLYYFDRKWIGGTLTNWKNVSLFLERARENKVKDDRRLKRLDRFYTGINDIKKLPDFVFIINPDKNIVAVREANKYGVPIVAIIDSNCNPNDITVPITINTQSLKVIELVCSLLIEAYADGRKNAKPSKFKKPSFSSLNKKPYKQKNFKN